MIRQDAGLTPAQQCELDTWVAADRRHHGAYIRARAAWQDTDRVVALAAGDSELTQGSETAAAIPVEVVQVEWTRKRGSPVRMGLWAAGIAMLAVAGALLWQVKSPPGRVYASEIGEVRNIELPDGSRLVLNTDTSATVHFKEMQRDISLKRGEALFKVARDASRPFIVRANNVLVRAVGTEFTVRIDDTRTDVIVTEGAVDVTRIDGSGSQTIQRVTANHRVMLASQESRPDVEAISSQTLTRELAWRKGLAAFAGEPLSEAVTEINRYSRHRIYVDDPELAARPVVGIFHANDAEAFVIAVEATFGAEAEHSNGEIHLRMGANSR